MEGRQAGGRITKGIRSLQKKTGMLVHVCNPKTWEVEAEGCKFEEGFEFEAEYKFEARLIYVVKTLLQHLPPRKMTKKTFQILINY
jgi:hypothetical protein